MTKERSLAQLDLNDMTKIRRLKRGFIGKLTTLTISSPYGNRRGGFHYGVDIVVPVGTKIYAPFAGKLTRKMQKSSIRSYGLYTEFNSGNITLLFAHLSKETENISEGAKTLFPTRQLLEIHTSNTHSSAYWCCSLPTVH